MVYETEEPTCDEVGFHRHPSDCAKFFRCVDFKYPTGALTIFHFDCPQGTIFDEVLSVCNWPEQAQPPCPEPEPVPEPEPEPETTTMAVEEAGEHGYSAFLILCVFCCTHQMLN